MEHLKTYYSLEKHLEQTILVNPQFEILNAIWKLNKKNLNGALSNVNQFFPHYSLHDKSHSSTIVHNIESFLGEDRIKRLSPTDTWLLLMAAFTHDLGMVVFHQIVEQAWPSKEFQEFLKELSDWDDEDIRSSAELLVRIQEMSKADRVDKSEWLSSLNPVYIKNSVTLVVAEYMRRIHHKRSADILQGIDKVFFQIANSFYSDQIPNRLLSVLGEVAYLHGVEFYEIFERLEFQSNGVSGDKIHPRFIAAMLRLGDLLDIDDNRFNVFTENVFKMPASSTEHKSKHSSVKHLLVTPQEIEITADCPSENVYRLARNWFDWLEKEVENQSKEWTNIVPKDLGGASPQIPKGKIKVYFKSEKANDSLLNLRFQVSNQKIFEILEGASIYENAEFTFIRELVQNALDASKIQLWKNIEAGIYDFILKKHFAETKDTNITKLSHQEILNNIEFPADIPDSIMESFQVKLVIDWESENKKNLLIRVEDNGTGISDNDLIRMTSRVGESRKKESGYTEMLQRMPFWLKPTGAFGIGLQSVFFVNDNFKVLTKSEGGESREIIFRSSKKGKYSSLTGNKPVMQRGTVIEVLISQDDFPEVFGTSFDWGIISRYDYFTDEYGSMYIPKIRAYIEKTLGSVNNLRVDFMGKLLFADKATHLTIRHLHSKYSEDRKVHFELIVYEEEIYFNFNESEIGSNFTLKFPSKGEDDIKEDWTVYHLEYFVRDIPVKTNTISFYKLSHAKLLWNFMSPESDKILSLTREKFLPNRKGPLVRKFLDEILPKSLPLIEESFLACKQELLKLYDLRQEELSTIYFKIILTRKVNNVEGCSLDHDLIGDFTLPAEIISTLNGSAIKYKDFFDIESIIIAIPDAGNFFNFSVQRELAEQYQKANSMNDPVCFWKCTFYGEYLRTAYRIDKVAFYDKGKVVELKRGLNYFSSVVIEGEEQYLKDFASRRNKTERMWNYAAAEYFERIAIVNNYASGFESFPYLSSVSIISPFKNLKAYKKLKKELSSLGNQPTSENISSMLNDQRLLHYVTHTLIGWIKENRLPHLQPVTTEQVLAGYRDLITRMIFLGI